MALMITDECINCGYCVVECPNQAIYEPGMRWAFDDGTQVRGAVTLKNGTTVTADSLHSPISEAIHYVVPEKCSECKGVFELPQCTVVCPIPSGIRRKPGDEKLTDLLMKQFQMNPQTA